MGVQFIHSYPLCQVPETLVGSLNPRSLPEAGSIFVIIISSLKKMAVNSLTARLNSERTEEG